MNSETLARAPDDAWRSVPATTSGRREWLGRWILGGGSLALLAPVAWDALDGFSVGARNLHTPLLLAASAWRLVCDLRGAPAAMPGPPARWVPPFTVGLVLFVVGNSQHVAQFEILALPLLLAGAVPALYGPAALRRIHGALWLCLLALPWPAFAIDAATQPLKLFVSHCAGLLLYGLGYPVAFDGVILAIGQYQLLVADACSGMRSLFALEAFGLAFASLVRRPGPGRLLLLALLIAPLAVAANIVRVVALALVTWHFGDSAGQGGVHELAGLLLFVLVLAAILRFSGDGRSQPAPVPSAGPRLPPGNALLLGGALIAAALAARALEPQARPVSRTSLALAVPERIAGWQALPADADGLPPVAAADGNSTDQPYDDVLLRTYATAGKPPLMLALAHAGRQRQDVKIHLPETCYLAQGYTLLDRRDVSLLDDRAIPGRRLLVRNRGRLEAVSYWVRIGDAYPRGGLAMRMQLLRDGFAGTIPDGMLVRVSSLVGNARAAEAAYARQEAFLAALIDDTRRDTTGLLAR